MKNYLLPLLLFFLPALAFASVLGTQQGGTGTSSPSGILFGNNNATPLSTLIIGTNLTLTGHTLSASGGGGSSTFGTSSLSALWPIIYTQNSSLAQFSYGGFGSTSDTGIGHNIFLYTSNGGILAGAASSSLDLPNSALQNSSLTINGTAFNLGDSKTITAATSSLLGDTNTFSGHDTFSNTITGSITGLSGTATALAANGTNCSAGNYALGVDASGNAEGCTLATLGTVTNVTATFPNQSTGGATPIISSLFSTTSNSGMTQGFQYVGNGGIFQTGATSTFFGYIPLNPTRQLTFNGTAQQITSSAGTQDLSADRTWTFSLPSHVKFPTDFEASAGSTTNATSTYLSVTGSSTLATVNGAGLASCTGGTNALTWTGGNFGCQSITASGGAFSFTPNATGFFNQLANSTSTQIHFGATGVSLSASSTAQFANSSTSLATIGTLFLTNPLSTQYGGTGLSNPGSSAAEALLEFGGNTGASVISPGAQFTVLQSTSGGGGFTTGAVQLAQSNAVTGTLPVGNGGTGDASLPGDQILYTNHAGNALLGTASSTLFSPTTAGFVWAYENGAWGAFATSTGGGSGTVTSISLVGLDGATPITTTGTITAQLGTSTASETKGQLGYYTTTSGTPALFAPISTSTPTFNGGLTTSGTAGALVGGSGYTISLAQIAGNNVLGCATSVTCTPGAVATSTLFNFTGGITATANTVSLSTYAANVILGTSNTGVVQATSSAPLWITNLFATSTTATSTFLGRLAIGTTTNAGIGISSLVASSTIYSYESNESTSTTDTINFTDSNQSLVYINTAGITFTFSNLTPGQTKRIIICNPAAGTPGALTWPNGGTLIWAGDTTPTATATNSKCDVYSFITTLASSSPEGGGGTVKAFGTQTANF